MSCRVVSCRVASRRVVSCCVLRVVRGGGGGGGDGGGGGGGGSGLCLRLWWRGIACRVFVVVYLLVVRRVSCICGCVLCGRFRLRSETAHCAPALAVEVRDSEGTPAGI